MFRPVLIDQQAILSFEAEDPIEHGGKADPGALTSILPFHRCGQDSPEFVGLELTVLR